MRFGGTVRFLSHVGSFLPSFTLFARQQGSFVWSIFFFVVAQSFRAGTTRAHARAGVRASGTSQEDACLAKLSHSFMLHSTPRSRLPRRAPPAVVGCPLTCHLVPHNNKKKCWCAAGVDLRHGDGTCDMACTGDAGTTCGGVDAFDLFELGSSLPPPEDPYLGCFADDKDDRVLGDMMSSGSMTLQVKINKSCFTAGGRTFVRCMEERRTQTLMTWRSQVALCDKRYIPRT